MKTKFTKLLTQYRVVVDTNVFTSGLLWGGKPAKVIELWLSGQVQLLISPQLASEVLLVLERFKYSPKELDNLCKSLKERARIIFPKRKTNICRDAKDNFILDLCLERQADYLVTGDKDLLELKKFKGTKILNPSQFLLKIKK